MKDASTMKCHFLAVLVVSSDGKQVLLTDEKLLLLPGYRSVNSTERSGDFTHRHRSLLQP